MKNRPLFIAEQYVGINIDSDSLETGKNKYPEAATMS
jgi:hypothetical protein